MSRVWCALGVFVVVAGSAVADLALVVDGNSETVICVPQRVMADDAPDTAQLKLADREMELQRQRLRESVRDLAHYFQKMSGAKIEIVSPPLNGKETRKPIYIAEASDEIWRGPARKYPFKQGFRVVIETHRMGLFGESDLASSYAVYEVLHRLGCRWFMPSEMGECIPQSATIRLNETDDSLTPGTIYRGIWHADDDYRRRNRMGGLVLAASHALDSYIPKDVLDQHPDWVAVIKGKPSPPIIKWSKPGVADAIADMILTSLEQGVYVWSASLSPEDGLLFDESDDREIDAGDFDPVFGAPSITDRLMVLANRVAAKVTAKYPDVLFGVLAYVNYNRPPVRETLHPNIVPVIAPITYSRAHPVTDEGEPNNKELRYLIEGWGKKARMTAIYYYGWNLAEMTAPNPMIRRWSIDVPYALKHGCLFFQPETDTNFETTMHALYLGNRLAWDPSLDPQAVIDDLNTRFYGNAATEMAAYWDYVDRLWVETPEYSGAALGYMRRFPLDRVKEMRRLLDAAIVKAQTPQEKFRITMADESLRQFESYMQMRWDLAEGKFATLAERAKAWVEKEHALAEQYRPQFAFTCRMYGQKLWGSNNGVDFFEAWYRPTYEDAARIARDFAILTPQPLRRWQYIQDEKKQGEQLGYARGDFDSSNWKSTDVAVETWSTLGMHNYYGHAWYRTSCQIPHAPAGRKTFLWLAGHDGAARVFVNGRLIPYINKNGEKLDEFVGFCAPGSFDITDALASSEHTTIAILCDRREMNEVGGGGLIGPLIVYRER